MDVVTKSLDLGCGESMRNIFNADEAYGVDIIDLDNPNIRKADLSVEPIPFEDNTFDYVTGFDFLEHIPRSLYVNGKTINPFIEIMNEIYRVLKPEGRFMGFTPAYPHPETFQDPTHVNFITEKTIDYFGINGAAYHYGKSYGLTAKFEIMGQGWHDQIKYWLVWDLKAVK
jgi:SAM-dependent methyltransferase